jgi:hypothetical protein
MSKRKLQEGFGLGELPSSKLMKMTMKLGDIMREPDFIPVDNAMQQSDVPTGYGYTSQEFVDHLKQQMSERIQKVDDKWVVYPSKGGERLGTHDTKREALKQLAAIEISKQRNK